MATIKKYENAAAIVADKDNLIKPFIAIAEDTGKVYTDEIPRITNTVTILEDSKTSFQLVYRNTNGSSVLLHNVPITSLPMVVDLDSYTENGGVACLYLSSSSASVYSAKADFSNAKFKDRIYRAFSTAGYTETDITGVNTTDVFDGSSAFYGNRSTTIVGLSSLDTRNFVTMRDMFKNAAQVTSLDLRTFNVSKVINFSGMFFSSINLTNLDISTWETFYPINVSAMFYNAGITTFGITYNINASGISNNYAYNPNSFYYSKLTKMDNMFKLSKVQYCNLSTFDLSTCDGNLTSVFEMSSLTSFTINTSSVFSNTSRNITSLASIFKNCSSLTTLYLDIDTTNVKNMTDWIFGCSLLSSINVSSNFFKSLYITTYDFSVGYWNYGLSQVADNLPQLTILGEKSLKVSTATKALIDSNPGILNTIISKNWSIIVV